MSPDLKPVAEALMLIRAFGDDKSHGLADNALALVKAHSCSSAAEAWKRAYNDDVERMAKAAADAELAFVEACEDRTALRGALEALVAGVEDAVLRFVESGELRLRADMAIVIKARVERARTALKETAP